LGDNTNYFVGRFAGEKIIQKDYRWFRKKYLYKTQEFYEKHGGKTVIVARFAPILRTFAPFVAGLGKMHYPRFFSFSIIGNILWVNSFCLAGHFFGNIPFVKKHFTAVIMAIIVISLLPAIITALKAWTQRGNPGKSTNSPQQPQKTIENC
jgi:membrane-associated protein